MASRYDPDQLKSDLILLNDRVAEVGAWLILIRDSLLEDAVKVLWNTADAIATGSNFDRSTFEFTKEELKNGDDMRFVREIYERCTPYAHLDPDPFVEAAEEFDTALLSMIDISTNPGNVLTDIGNWYGDAAESFEEHLIAFGIAKDKQAEVMINLVNGCASIHDLIVNTQTAIRDLVGTGIELAEERAKNLEKDSSAKDEQELKRLIFYTSAGVSAGAFTKVAQDLEDKLTGSSLLTFAALQFQNAEIAVIAEGSAEDIPESMRLGLNDIETSFLQGDEQVSNELEKILYAWPMRELVFPPSVAIDDPAGGGFQHETEL